MTSHGPPTSPYVFISYTSTDQERALQIADRVEAAGVCAWVDRRSIAGGTSWDAEIVRGIKNSAVVAVVCSATALGSANVQQELRLAMQYQKPLLPLLLESVTFPEEVEYALVGRQWVELLDHPENRWLPDILAALARLGLTPRTTAANSGPAIHGPAVAHVRAAATPLTPGVPGHQPAGRQPAILVVDDLPANIRLLEAILTPRGYRVVTARSGPEALLRAAERPDLVLLDIVMPGMDGYEVCRRLRDDPAMNMLPIVLITASGDQEKLKAIEAGADDFITKPLSQPELLARIRSLLRIKTYHDTIERQAAELADWNRSLTERVEARTAELVTARAQILELYQELARRNQQLHDLVERLTAATEHASQQSSRRGDARILYEKLTPRERDVLRLLAQGQTNAAIAAELVVSVTTAKFHVENIIAKLGVADRTQAAVRAVELGLLETPTD